MIYLRKPTIIFFILLAVFIVNISAADTIKNDFIGRWCWDKNSKVSTFSVFINKIVNTYKGSYLTVAFRGNRIDDSEDAFSFKASGKKIVKTKLRTGSEKEAGLIQLKILSNNKMEWFIIKFPRGEFYAPRKAILHKCN